MFWPEPSDLGRVYLIELGQISQFEHTSYLQLLKEPQFMSADGGGMKVERLADLRDRKTQEKIFGYLYLPIGKHFKRVIHLFLHVRFEIRAHIQLATQYGFYCLPDLFSGRILAQVPQNPQFEQSLRIQDLRVHAEDQDPGLFFIGKKITDKRHGIRAWHIDVQGQHVIVVLFHQGSYRIALSRFLHLRERSKVFDQGLKTHPHDGMIVGYEEPAGCHVLRLLVMGME
jgi:hypothetical protein